MVEAKSQNSRSGNFYRTFGVSRKRENTASTLKIKHDHRRQNTVGMRKRKIEMAKNSTPTS